MDRRLIALFLCLSALSAPLAAAAAPAAEHRLASPACKPFLLYRGAMPLFMWQKHSREVDTENQLLAKIARLKGQEAFSGTYETWRLRGADGMSEEERLDWLRCVSFYLSRYTDSNGAPAYTALVDGTPSTTLLPVNANFFDYADPNPLDVPPHLKDSRPKIARLQNQLFHEFGILAINHSDRHAPAVLESLLLILEHGLPNNAVRLLKNFRVLYAFESHDAEIDIAAYHSQMKAISIGGMSVYGHSKAVQRVPVLAALAHELGHAFLFQHLSPDQLMQIAADFGAWQKPKDLIDASTLFSPLFFTALSPVESSQANRLVSSYAATNLHEWFADTFAAAVLVRLGRMGLLGHDWRRQLIVAPTKKRYWVDYNNVPVDFMKWLQAKLLEWAKG